MKSANVILFLTALCVIPAGAARADEPPLLPIEVTSPGEGLLSLGVYDEAGTLIRSLAYAREVNAGMQTQA